jgi:uncharacterized protein YndB with AHSA1/START domain
MTTKAQVTQGDATTDRIEKRVELRAPRSKVWRALSDAKEFGTWFRARLDGEFTEGTTIRGNILHPGYEHVVLEMEVQRIEPERYFSYRWHPAAIDAKADYSAEPTTLVEFTLEDADGGAGTVLTIIESGFDRLPSTRRAEAFRMNERGWDGQSKLLAEYVSKP